MIYDTELYRSVIIENGPIILSTFMNVLFYQTLFFPFF